MAKIDLSEAVAGADPSPGFFSAQIQEAHRFCLALNPPAQSRLFVVCGGLEHCAGDYNVNRTAFRYHAIEYVAGGRGSLTLHGQTYPLGPGHIFTYGPGVSHEIRSDARHRLTKYFVTFTGSAAGKLLTHCGLESGTIVQTTDPGSVHKYLDELIATAIRRGPRAQPMCTLILEQLLHRVFETFTSAGSLETKAFATFERCRKHLREHYIKLNDVKAVARSCDVDASYLCRLFQRFEKRGPYQYLMHLKMTHAARLLQRPAVLVKEVAFEMGFSDQFQFSRAFRRVHGISPRHLQRINSNHPAGI